MTNEQKVKFRCIGLGFCGTVWAFSERGSAYKREDERPERSLNNDFRMHRRALGSFREFSDILTPQIQIPRCYRFIRPTATKWWSKNLTRFPAGYSPCKMIHCQRIPPFPESTRKFLINKYCPRRIRRAVWLSDASKDCMVRPCLGRRRTQTRADRPPPFDMFSLRNCPLLADQMEEIGIPPSDMQQYARIMAEALAMLHWIGQMDGNDIKFVLTPPIKRRSPSAVSTILGEHTMWMFDFDLCRKMPMNVPDVKQAVRAFWRDDIFFPQPALFCGPGQDSKFSTALEVACVHFRHHSTLSSPTVCIMASNKTFFGSRFTGSEVKFAGANPSTWNLIKKLSEQVNQQGEYEYEESKSPSAACALFQCRDSSSSKTAILKINMQIPFAGSESEQSGVRSQQTSNELTYYADNELTALRTLTRNGCESAPTLLNYKLDRQDKTGVVPGGFILFLLMNELPGSRLTSSFWNLPTTEGDDIRQAFRIAYEDCVKAGVRNFAALKDILFWDKQSRKIYITSFRLSRLEKGKEDTWTDNMWIQWGLARG